MASSSGDTMANISLQPTSVDEYSTTQATHETSVLTVAQNTSGHDGCIRVVFSEMEFLPWDNPDSIISSEVETIIQRATDLLMALLFLIGGPGNVINMAVFYKQGLKDRVNLCLFALALADELFVIIIMFVRGEQVHLQFTTGEKYGPLTTFVTNNHFTFLLGSRYISSALSAVIASERCYCVLHPLRYHTLMRTRTMAAIIIVVYLMGMGLYSIVAFQYHIGCLYDPQTDVVISTNVMGEFYKAHLKLIEILRAFFIIGLIIMVTAVVTVTTIVTAVKLGKVAAWRSGTSVSISSREVVSLTKMLIGSSILFIICVSPTCVTLLLWSIFPGMNSGERNHNFYLTTIWIAGCFAYINCCFNICVYYSMGSRYRETFWALFRRTLSTDQKA